MKPRTVTWLSVAVLGLATAIWVVPIAANYIAKLPSPTRNVDDKRVFYRLTSSYLHGDERIDFNIVVACSVRITGYKDNSSSFDAIRFPVNYTKGVHDGAAIMQLVPDACDGSTTVNGGLPKDLLPGAIWFDSKDDLSLGIGYLTEAAYENPKSKLKFLGASIDHATSAEWDAFRIDLSKSILDPSVFVKNPPWPNEEEVRTNLWNKAKLSEWTRNSMECFGYARYHMEGPDIHQFLEQFRPDNNPRFWTVRDEDAEKLGSYFIRPDKQHIPGRLDGHFKEEYETGPGPKAASGFPTRAQGGMVSSKIYSRRASDLYPMKADDGVPWARSELQPETTTLYRDLDFENGANIGFAYCYALYWGRGAVGDLHLPGYGHRKKVTRIDGVEVMPDPNSRLPGAIPSWVIENTDYLYVAFHYSIN